MNKISFFIIGLFIAVGVSAQNKISLEDIWARYSYYPEGVDEFNFLKDGVSYSVLEENVIKQYNLKDGSLTGNICDKAAFNIEDYTFSDDEQMMLLASNVEKVYRRSSKANYYVFDRKTGVIEPLSDNGKQQYATFSPDNSKVAFCRENNLFYKDLKSGKEIQVTKDGAFNKIINGSTDWVYEEEFEITRAFEWSPDGKYIAYIRFDESNVPMFSLDFYKGGLYPEKYEFKYPKAGEKNSTVKVFLYNLAKKKQVPAKVLSDSEAKDYYIPRMKWANANEICIFKMNRHQNLLELMLTNAQTGVAKTMLKEENPYYIDINNNLTFLNDGQFVWTSEQDGYNHIYLYDASGKVVNQITSGKWDVTGFYGVDEKNKCVYYQSAEESPLQRAVYKIGLDGKSKNKLTALKGSNEAQFSKTFDYFVWSHQSLTTPPYYAVCDSKGKEIRVLEDNKDLKDLIAKVDMKFPEFYNFKTSEGVELNGWMIKPANFDPNKKYPVFMYLYGGPGSQEVMDDWDSFNRMWFQMLAQKGYIVACVDNRGTGARGQEFKKCTYKQLGKLETQDQIEAAKWLGKQSYIDASRIGIFGWSYGGYMSSLCLFKGSDVFKMAISVAPVTNWKWYDSIYTERYMQTPGENNSGYEENSPVNFAKNLKGKFLLVHGITDDNVHFQNGAELANALILANKQFDCQFYPNSNHGIGGGAKRMHLYTKMTDFILENL